MIHPLSSRETTSVSFLLLAPEFREVRNVERQTLGAMEATEMVKRGTAYLKGLPESLRPAIIYILVALSVAAVSELWLLWAIGAGDQHLVGALMALVLVQLMQGDRIDDIATVELVEVKFDGAHDHWETVMMNVDYSQSRPECTKRGDLRPYQPQWTRCQGYTGQSGPNAGHRP